MKREKTNNHIILLLIILSISHVCKSQQNTVRGYVIDSDKKAMEEAIVYFKNNPILYDITDSIGFFELSINGYDYINDSLVVSFLGYKKTPLSYTQFSDNKNVIVLEKDNMTLQEVVVFFNKSFVSDFSTSSIQQLEIYTNPVAQADPLNAIQSLPVSTNTLESAAPMLRGSPAQFSRVFLNGVPIYYPTKGNLLNNTIASSSIFSTSLIREEEIYASNPPVYYGNVSGGVVDMRLNNKTQNKKTLFLSLIGGSFSMSAPYSKTDENGFFETYLNYTNLNPLKVLNKTIPDVNHYSSYDCVVRNYIKSGRATLSLYTSIYNEKGNYVSSLYSYKGDYRSNNLFNNNIINYYLPFDRNIIETNLSSSYLNNSMNYGNMNLDKKNHFIYASMGISRFFTKKMQIKLGGNYEFVNANIKGLIPLYYYSYYPNTPNEKINVENSFNKSDIFFLLKNEFGNITSNIGVKYTFNRNEKSNFSYQLNFKYLSSNSKNKFLFSIGKYYSHDFMSESYIYPLQSCFQYTFEYIYFTQKFQLQTAFYKKHENYYQEQNLPIKGEADRDIMGMELMVKLQVSKYISLQLSNLYLDSKIRIGNEGFTSFDNLKYFIKTTLYYDHPKSVGISANFFLRPGAYYTPIINSSINENIGVYIPTYSSAINSAQYNRYSALNLNVSKGFKKKRFSYSVFCGVNNILDKKNENQIYYNIDYKKKDYNYFTRRTFFAGCIIHFK
ncbi:MAG: TonB-dependent receptor [Bacteroidales bacterium]|jgi:hypothetical protein|nr:TonB-dependent receptor [Bacteroidales bacterium]